MRRWPLLNYGLYSLQPLFLFCVVPAFLFAPQFVLNLYYVNGFFSFIECVYIYFLFRWRMNEKYFNTVFMLAVVTFPSWILLDILEKGNKIHLSVWTAIYFQTVIWTTYMAIKES